MQAGISLCSDYGGGLKNFEIWQSMSNARRNRNGKGKYLRAHFGFLFVGNQQVFIFSIIEVVDFPSTKLINSILPPFSIIAFASGRVSTV